MNNLSLDKKILVYIFVSFVFSIAVRLIWVYQFWDFDSFKWNGQFMINTNDGYYWAEGARDFLRGFHQENDLSPIYRMPSVLTAFFAKVLPFSFESVIFYISVFLSSLIVVPMVLIGKNLGRVELGFISALIASVTWSYYNRTMVGYYDTDMLNIVFPTFLLWSLILAIRTKEDKYLIFTALEIVGYRLWYPQSYSLEFAFFGLIFLYTVIFKRKEIYNYKLLTIMLFAMMGLPSSVRLIAVTFLYFVYKRYKRIDDFIYYLLGFAFLMFLLTGGFSPIWGQLKGYVFKESVKSVGDDIQLHFFSVMQTVREAGKIPFETFANRISGHSVTFVFAVLGYILMLFRYPVMFLGLPMVGLGFLAYVGGLRFTIYAVPVMAFGIAYLILFFGDFLEKFLTDSKGSRYIKTGFISVLVVLVLYPNILHVISYKVPTVFSKNEVKVLDKLKKTAQREDYVVSWWDYGYPIRYYSDVKTLIDGGKHKGEVNFPVSFILTHSQKEAANMARLDVEYTEKSFYYDENNPDRNRSNIANMMKTYGFNDSNEFLLSLKKDIKLPEKTRNVYLYLPFRMLNIYPTVSRFSDLDLMSGEVIRRPFFYQTRRFKNEKNRIVFANGLYLDKSKGILHIGKQKVPLKSFIKVAYDKKLKLRKSIQNLNDKGFSIIFLESYKTFIILDESLFNSTFIQLFVLENFDKKLFEPVILTPSAKVFRLKL